MDLLKDEIVAGGSLLAIALIDPSNQRTAHGE
jgi:hypothetical protein